MKSADASLSSVVVLPFLPIADSAKWRVDRAAAGVALVPMLSLGRKVDVLELANDMYQFNQLQDAAGGPFLRILCLDETMFRADAMLSANADLAEMRVEELKGELEVRGEPRTGPKSMLQIRRLHAAIVRDVLKEQNANNEDGE